MMKQIFVTLLIFFLFVTCIQAQEEVNKQYIQFIFSSDSHYGLFREFRGRPAVSSSEVNRAMLVSMHQLGTLSLPKDKGVKAGEKVGAIDFVVNTGNITNRMEKGVQSAANSWEQFKMDWLDELNLLKVDGTKVPVCLLPGNHDVSNRIGYFRPMLPLYDSTVLIQIYHQMLSLGKLETVRGYNYFREKIRYAFSLAGIRFVFVSIWPDSETRKWLEADLLANSQPCLLFTHDQPEVEACRMINPNGKHDINSFDQFENLLPDTSSVTSVKSIPWQEHRAFATFLKQHPTIKAYFHGNDNYNEFYIYRGPDRDITLPVFRVDSPMMGKVSADDETRLSYQMVTIDPEAQKMTVRECLWNVDGGNSLEWGDSKTISW